MAPAPAREKLHMERSPLLIGLCMRNLAYGLRTGTVSGLTAATALEALAAEVERGERDPVDELTPQQAGRILAAIRREEEKQ